MEVKLNPNGWHKRLQKFVFKYPPHFYNFCPYFWLTIFCVLVTFIIPVVPLAKGFKYLGIGLVWLFTKSMDLFNDWICEPLFEWMAKNMPEDDVIAGWTSYTSKDGYHFYNDIFSQWDQDKQTDFMFWRDEYSTLRNMSYEKRDKYREKFQLWKKDNPDWEKKIEAIKAKKKAYWLKRAEIAEKERHAEWEKEKKKSEERAKNYEKEQLRERKKRETFNSIVKYTKYLAYALGISVILFAAYWMFRFVSWVYEVVNWPAFWNGLLVVLKWGGLIVAGVVVLVGLIYGLILLLKKCKISFSDIPGMKYLGHQIGDSSKWVWKNTLVPFGMLIYKFLYWVAGGFEFLYLYFKTLKENNCPAIIWEDEKPEKI